MCKEQFCVSNGQVEKSAEQRAVWMHGGIQDTLPDEAITQFDDLHASDWTLAISLKLPILCSSNTFQSLYVRTRHDSDIKERFFSHTY